jgi:hypothetical protein
VFNIKNSEIIFIHLFFERFLGELPNMHRVVAGLLEALLA